MKHLTTLFLMLFGLSAATQTTQKGWATQLNSNKNPVAGVEIIFYGAGTTTSGSDGNFALLFKQKKPGDLIVYDQIYKKGYELVNEKELQTAKLSQHELKIILATVGTVAQLQAKYYDISIKALTAGHDRKIRQLKKRLGQAQINEEKFVAEKRKLNEELENAKKTANELAEQFARTNFDDVGDLYKRAFEQFKQGQIQKAINILNEKDLIAEAQKLQRDKARNDSLKQVLAHREQENLLRRDTLMRTIKLKAELYALQFEYDSAGILYRQLWQLDTTHVENTYNYANFLSERKQYDKALMFYRKLMNMPGAEAWRIGNAIGNSGEIYREIGKFPQALSAYKKSLELYEQLHKTDAGNSFYKGNIAISYEKIGVIYLAQGNFEKALEFFTLYDNLSKELYQANPKSERLKEGLASSYEKLGVIYQAQGNFEKALEFFTLYNNLSKELYQANPKSERLKEGLASSYEKLGVIYQAQGNFEKALEFFTLYNNLSKELYQANPKSESLKKGLAISYERLGVIYQAQGNFEKALEFFTLRSQLGKELYQANPKSESLKNGLAISYEKLGEIYQAQDNFEKALEFFTLRSQLGKELYQANPKSESLKYGLAISYSKLGWIYQDQGNFEKALEFFTLYNNLSKELSQANPKSESLKNGLAISYEKLGEIYQAQGNFEKALEFFTLDIELMKELSQANSKSESLKNGLAISYEKLGEIYQAQGNFEKALEFFTLYNNLSKELSQANPKSLNLYLGLGVSYYKLGSVYAISGENKKAVENYLKAVEVFSTIYKQTQIEQYKGWSNAVQGEIDKLK